MQSQMIGLQSSLDRILTHLQNPSPVYPPTPSSAPVFGPPSSNDSRFSSSTSASKRLSPEAAFFPTTTGGTAASGGQRAGSAAPGPSSTREGGSSSTGSKQQFPPLPGFAPPPHKYVTYGVVPGTAPFSDDESENTLPRATLNMPIESLQGLANAAAEAAASTVGPIASPP
jgi:hypothetical protein